MTRPSLRVNSVGIDVNDLPAMRDFWRSLTEYEVESSDDEHTYLVEPSGIGPNLFLQRVPEARVGKNRLHLDLESSNLAAATRSALAVGATLVEHHEAGDSTWTVFADPEGNVFCITSG
jgi:predicted enzyme related to lactoylglutathione lyase